MRPYEFDLIFMNVHEFSFSAKPQTKKMQKDCQNFGHLFAKKYRKNLTLAEAVTLARPLIIMNKLRVGGTLKFWGVPVGYS